MLHSYQLDLYSEQASYTDLNTKYVSFTSFFVFSFAAAGNDFTGITNANAIPIIFPVGSTNTKVTVPITNDGEFEGIEHFYCRLQPSSIAPTNFRIRVDTATVVITEGMH